MVTAFRNTERVIQAGLSTDVKPTAGVANGTCFIEMDTGSRYLFDEENATWYKMTGSGGGGAIVDSALVDSAVLSE